MADRLVVRGAREHNLKGVDIDIPRDKMVVLPVYPAPVNLRWPLTPSSLKVSAATWNP